jgi:hypothetical protein
MNMKMIYFKKPIKYLHTIVSCGTFLGHKNKKIIHVACKWVFTCYNGKH